MSRRRYRLFTICAIVIVIFVYRALQTSWTRSADPYDSINSHPKSPVQPLAGDGTDQTDLSGHASPPLLADEQDEAARNSHGDVDLEDKPKSDGSSIKPVEDKSPAPPVVLATDNGEAVEEKAPEDPMVHWSDPPLDNQNLAHSAEDAKLPREHWTRPRENFPIPEGSLIPIPSGTPKKIPKIQFDFGTESDKAKTTRIMRLGRVKAELERAWSGYRKYAWMHDELSPLSNQFRDPFCGWAATLVDSLDTLWIAGMKDQFDEAARAVAKIDFTFTPKNDIPVFETTIRYLGGLLAAYDVSGGPDGDYEILLTKAVELGEILMGIFDTPNRMPILFYVWRPPYSSEPHRASSVGIAELTTLSMEFTRLAQLTGTAKYYDAIDRITNAIVLMQKDGHTDIPGLFPERIDASGCNKTATTIRNKLSEEAQKQMDSEELAVPPKGFEPETEKKLNARAVIPALESDGERSETTASDDALAPPVAPPAAPPAVPPVAPPDAPHEAPLKASQDTPPGDPFYTPPTNEQGETPNVPRIPPLSADGSTSKWDCVPQGLVPATHGGAQYHMGGAQDSAYEYFPKQYLLLGGLEPKYQKLHEDTIDAINERLLYRPMIDGDWDILLPAKLTVEGRAHKTNVFSYELAHLTCFIGGMYGLGGKIFNRPEDIETAKKLTDACVWAYQSTPTGIMPEFAHLAPCPSLEKCEFNETAWWESLDPSIEWRKGEMAKWEKNQAQAAKKQASAEADVLKKQDANGVENTEEHDIGEPSKDANHIHRPDDLSVASKPESKADPEAELKAKDMSYARLQKRGKRAGGIPMPELDTELSAPKGETGSELPDSLKKKLHVAAERWKEANPDEEDPGYIAPPPTQPVASYKPMTHEEYVQNKLSREALPRGYTDIENQGYILRPEAIESVWYMYRITGDPEWMDKGWKMFEATVAATRTEFANSAIDDVMVTSPGLRDEMESFWIAETLKYYYLLFAEPDLISLDEWVLNTEAHPFKRPS
ncbi:hypothetical protein AK830_g5659 [Neonectria ditissima]|uniref:alpha-1,2-Mannosidase n=1 Tax=Neonectria ditissima TaxID=78410 RepID=A0A0P7AST3_9HYPO|nr:hypothetical protein AK830_g5659 [Neonectria ditissima]